MEGSFAELLSSVSFPKLLLVFLAWNLLVFFLYGTDKLKAKKGAWRISEKTLLLCALLLGGVGAFAGMKVFRHKTKHMSFNILVPVFALLSLVAMYYLYTKTGW